MRKPRTLHGIKRTLAALFTVLLLIVGMTLVSAGSASAQTDPMPPTAEFPYPHDGCTLVPDEPVPGISFNTACNHHDGCYYTHAYSRSTCDAIFYKELLATCNANKSNHYYACLGVATLYYLGVRIFGQPFYDASNTTTRTLTPMKA